MELEPVCISGRRRYKVVKRRKTLHNVKSDQLGYGEVHSVKELKETPLTFKSSFPLKVGWQMVILLWMKSYMVVPNVV